MFPHFFVSFFLGFNLSASQKRERREEKGGERALFSWFRVFLSSLPQKIQKILSTQNELCLRVKVAHVAYDPMKRTKTLLFSTSLVFCSLRFRFDVSLRANIL